MMEGMQEGTLFNREVVEAEENASRCTSTAASEDGDSLETVRDLALDARTASRKLAACPTEVTPVICGQTRLSWAQESVSSWPSPRLMIHTGHHQRMAPDAGCLK